MLVVRYGGGCAFRRGEDFLGDGVGADEFEFGGWRGYWKRLWFLGFAADAQVVAFVEDVFEGGHVVMIIDNCCDKDG
jgi:hypothetical protein